MNCENSQIRAAEAALAKAKAALVIRAPFYGALATMSPVDIKPAADIGALAATDGEKLYMSAELLTKYKHAEIVGVLAHEVEHVVRMHSSRAGGRDARLWNVAADYLINSALVSQGFSLPAGVLLNPAYNDSAYTTESLYDMLSRADKSDADNPLDGDVQLSSHEGSAEQRARVASRVAAAAAAARGKVPGHLSSAIASLGEPVIDWREALAAHLRTVAGRGSTETWSRLNRRLQACGYRLPARQDVAAPPLGVVIDTSGSVVGRCGDFVAEVAAIAEGLYVPAMHVVMCDTEVAWQATFTMGEPVELASAHGGGGTDLRVGIDAVLDAGAEVIVVLTDCDTPWPATFERPTIIVGVGSTPGPDGAVYIHMD